MKKSKVPAPAAVEEAPPIPAKPQPAKIATLAEIQAMCEQPVIVDLVLNGKPIQIEARRLRPVEQAQLDEILSSVVPKMEKGRTMEEDRPLISDPVFIKAKREVEIRARALALYWCVPLFAAEQPNLAGQAVVEFVQSKLNEDLLDVLYQAVRSGGVSLAELANFS